MLRKSLPFLLIPFTISCTTNPPPKDNVLKSNDITLKDGSLIKVNYAYNKAVNDKDKIQYLHIVHPSHAVGTTGLYIVSGILKAFTQGGSINTFNKEDLVGSEIKVENINLSYTYPKYIEFLKKNLVMTKKGNYINSPITVYPGRFYLVYDEMVGNDNYTLYAKFIIDFQDTIWHKRTIYNFSCSESAKGKTEKEWSANNYGLTVIEGKKLIDQCFSKMDSEYLQKVAKDIELNAYVNGVNTSESNSSKK